MEPAADVGVERHLSHAGRHISIKIEAYRACQDGLGLGVVQAGQCFSHFPGVSLPARFGSLLGAKNFPARLRGNGFITR